MPIRWTTRAQPDAASSSAAGSVGSAIQTSACAAPGSPASASAALRDRTTARGTASGPLAASCRSRRRPSRPFAPVTSVRPFSTAPTIASRRRRAGRRRGGGGEADGDALVGGRAAALGEGAQRDERVGFGVVGGGAAARDVVGADAEAAQRAPFVLEAAGDVDRVAGGEAARGDLLGMHEDDAAIAAHAAVAVVVAVHGGVELIVA